MRVVGLRGYFICALPEAGLWIKRFNFSPVSGLPIAISVKVSFSMYRTMGICEHFLVWVNGVFHLLQFDASYPEPNASCVPSLAALTGHARHGCPTKLMPCP